MFTCSCFAEALSAGESEDRIWEDTWVVITGRRTVASKRLEGQLELYKEKMHLPPYDFPAFPLDLRREE